MIFSLKTPYWISLPTIWVLVCLAAISLQLFISRPCSGSPSPGCLSLLFSKGQGCRVPCLLWSKLSLATGTVPSLPSCYQSAITFPLFDFFFPWGTLGDSHNYVSSNPIPPDYSAVGEQKGECFPHDRLPGGWAEPGSASLHWLAVSPWNGTGPNVGVLLFIIKNTKHSLVVIVFSETFISSWKRFFFLYQQMTEIFFCCCYKKCTKFWICLDVHFIIMQIKLAFFFLILYRSITFLFVFVGWVKIALQQLFAMGWIGCGVL